MIVGVLHVATPRPAVGVSLTRTLSHAWLVSSARPRGLSVIPTVLVPAFTTCDTVTAPAVSVRLIALPPLAIPIVPPTVVTASVPLGAVLEIVTVPLALAASVSVAVVALIPFALWFFKRSPMGARLAGMTPGAMRTVASLSLSPSQKVVTIEVGGGDERRWLVLGVASGGINLLYSLTPPPAAAQIPPTPAEGFAQLLSRISTGGSDKRAL